jgi:hypothetical protein
MEKKTPDDADPAGSPVLLCGIKRGALNMRGPASGRRFPEEPLLVKISFNHLSFLIISKRLV